MNVSWVISLEMMRSGMFVNCLLQSSMKIMNFRKQFPSFLRQWWNTSFSLFVSLYEFQKIKIQKKIVENIDTFQTACKHWNNLSNSVKLNRQFLFPKTFLNHTNRTIWKNHLILRQHLIQNLLQLISIDYFMERIFLR